MSATPPARILMLTHEFHPRRGGITTFVEEMAVAAAQSGRAVTVWAPASGPGTPPRSRPFAFHPLPLRRTHGPINTFRMMRAVWRDRAELRGATVHLAEPGPMLAFMWLQCCATLPPHDLVLTFHGSEILRFHHHPVRRLLSRRLIRRATRISTLSRFTRNLLLQYFPEAAGKIVLTPGAVRAMPPPAPPRRPDATRRLIVLTVGRLHPRKGQLATLRALQALPPELLPRVEYWIAGGGSKPAYARRLRRAAQDAPLAVRFWDNPAAEQLDALYAQADVFALTSLPYRRSLEGFGLVYLEASAHGLPIVAHDIGGVGEAVLSGATGLLVPPDQPAALTAAFTRLLNDADLRARLGAAGREWAGRTSWRRSAELLFGPASVFSNP